MLIITRKTMHRRPSLKEALSVLKSFANSDDDVASLLDEYNELKSKGEDFLAARLVVETVDYFYHVTGVQEYG
jgi:hypothetical protein